MAGRITRKELKTDKFAVEVEHTVDFVTQHRRPLVLYGSLAVAVALISVGAYFYIRHQHMLREQALADAIQIQETAVGQQNPNAPMNFATEDAKRAAASKAFSEIIAKYPGTNEAAIAKYYLGASMAEQGKLADAQRLFQEAVETGDQNYASLARFSLAQVYDAENHLADAEKILRDLIAHPTALVSKEQATIELAKLIAPTKPAEAKKLLDPLRAQSGPVSQAALGALSDQPAQ
ncbi:MAG TPA: tetratricopeptide repeat protein [Bryobacteraceae bacterium]|nr:tetratricopeptide repeat protein [Bryobacteraceae bacterium]